MKKLFFAFLDPTSKKRSRIWLLVTGLLVLASAIVGISDNPPGIFLAYLSMVALVMAFVHPWQQPKKYLFLALFALLTFILSAVLHNVFEGVGMLLASQVWLSESMNVLGVIFFLMALFLCPAALLVGVVGAIVCWIKGAKSTAA